MANNKYTFDHEPTIEEIAEALKDIPAWPGSAKTLGVNYPEYIVALEQSPKNKPTVWNPYVMVDGRVRMFNDAHLEEGKGYNEEIIPPIFSGPQNQSFDKFMVVALKINSEIFGIREDMAVALIGGSTFSADATNPAENAMTSVRGRVLAAFGVGIIPTMGMASAEEIKGAIERKSGIVKNEDAATTTEPAEKKTPAKKSSVKKLNVPRKGSEDKEEDKPTTEEEQREKLAKSAYEDVKDKNTSFDEMIAAHIESRSDDVELDDNWREWPLQEIIKLRNTVREINKR